MNSQGGSGVLFARRNTRGERFGAIPYSEKLRGNMLTIKIQPIYGYGWMKGEETIAVPASFEIAVSRAEKKLTSLARLLGK